MHCPDCGRDVSSQYSYCLNCGARIDPEATVIRANWQPGEPQSASPSRLNYVGVVAATTLILGLVALCALGGYVYLSAPRNEVAQSFASSTPSPALPRSTATVAAKLTPSLRPSPAASLESTPTPEPSPKTIHLPDPTKALAETMQVEQSVNAALASGARASLDRDLADEFINVAPNGSSQNKEQYLDLSGLADLKGITCANQRLVGINKGTVTIALTKYYTYNTGAVRFSQDTDAFIWRDGRWQMLYSHSARRL